MCLACGYDVKEYELVPARTRIPRLKKLFWTFPNLKGNLFPYVGSIKTLVKEVVKIVVTVSRPILVRTGPSLGLKASTRREEHAGVLQGGEI